jgi:hypothetical protein
MLAPIASSLFTRTKQPRRRTAGPRTHAPRRAPLINTRVTVSRCTPSANGSLAWSASPRKTTARSPPDNSTPSTHSLLAPSRLTKRGSRGPAGQPQLDARWFSFQPALTARTLTRARGVSGGSRLAGNPAVDRLGRRARLCRGEARVCPTSAVRDEFRLSRGHAPDPESRLMQVVHFATLAHGAVWTLAWPRLRKSGGCIAGALVSARVGGALATQTA